MNNTRAGRHNFKVVECFRAPLEELEPFAVAREFGTLIKFKSARDSSLVNLDGVVNDEIDGAKRVDLGGVTTKTCHSVTHSCEVNDGGYTSMIEKAQT